MIAKKAGKPIRFLLVLVLTCSLYQTSNSQILASASNFSKPQRQGNKVSRQLSDVLAELKAKYNVTFLYEKKNIEGKAVTTANNFVSQSSEIEVLLNTLLSPVDLKFEKVKDGTYAILLMRGSDELNKMEKKKTSENATASTSDMLASIQSKDFVHFSKLEDPIVTGKITSETGEGIPGANILLKGTTIGTVSDANGNFSLAVPDLNGTLLISYVGYTNEEMPIGGKSVLEVNLVPDITTLSEVVVVGYGTQRRSDLTGSVTSVKTDDIKNVPARNLGEALQGRVAGLTVTQQSGNPRSQSDIILRGATNLQGTPPLYVVDGIPFIGTNYSFNIQDVESVDILKDASAAAIYGTLASGGVILITTKKGKKGKMQVNLDATYGFTEVRKLPKLLNSTEYINTRTAFGHAKDAYGDIAKIDSLPNTNWYDELYRRGKQQNITLSLSGGSEKSNFYSSVNYNRNDGIRIGNWTERYGLRLNSDHKINKRLTIGQTLYASIIGEDPANPSNQGYLSFRTTPLMKVYDDRFVGGWGRNPKGFQGTNEVGNELIRYQRNKDYEVNLSGYWEVEIIKNLKFRNNLAINQYGSDNYSYFTPYSFGTVNDTKDNFEKFMSQNRNYMANFVLNYSKIIGDHNISAMIGYELRSRHISDLRGNSQSAFIQRPQSFDLVSSSELARPTGKTLIEDKYLSQFSRLTYSFKDKYLFTGIIRRDGSATKFGPNNKFGVFPTASVAWKISEEGFMKNIALISMLKIRAGYGTVGSEPSDRYLYLSGFQGGNKSYIYDFARSENAVRVSGATFEAKLANPNIKWETVATTNLAVEGALFNNKVNFTFEVYNKQTKDMIYNFPLPLTAGLGANYQQNIGEMVNKGFEFLIDYRNKTNDFTYGISINGAYNENKLISLNTASSLGFYDGETNSEFYEKVSPSFVTPGQPIGIFYGYKTAGIYQDNVDREKRPTVQGATYRGQEGDLIYVDKNGDGKIDVADRQKIGNPWPKLNYGFTLSVGYKGLDLQALFNGVQGVDIYNAAESFEYSFYSDYNTTNKIYETSFFGENKVTNVPRVGRSNQNQDPNGNWRYVSDYHVKDGSFLRLSNLQLGYSLPSSILSKIGVGSARIFVMTNNVLTLTKYKGYDPEISGGVKSRGVDRDWNRYPLTKVYSLGLNFQF